MSDQTDNDWSFLQQCRIPKHSPKVKTQSWNLMLWRPKFGFQQKFGTEAFGQKKKNLKLTEKTKSWNTCRWLNVKSDDIEGLKSRTLRSDDLKPETSEKFYIRFNRKQQSWKLFMTDDSAERFFINPEAESSVFLCPIVRAADNKNSSEFPPQNQNSFTEHSLGFLWLSLLATKVNSCF